MDEDLVLFQMIQTILAQSQRHHLATAKDAQSYSSAIFLTLDLIRIQAITNEVLDKFQGSKSLMMIYDALDGSRLKLSITLEALPPDQVDPTDLTNAIYRLDDKTEPEIRAILEKANLHEVVIEQLLITLRKGKDDEDQSDNLDNTTSSV